MESLHKEFENFDLAMSPTRHSLLKKKLEYLQCQLDYLVYAYQMTYESLQRTIRGLVDVTRRHVSILVLRGDKLRYETRLADMEEEVFQMMQTVRDMRKEYREFMAQIQAPQDQDGELQAQAEGDGVEGELCS